MRPKLPNNMDIKPLFKDPDELPVALKSESLRKLHEKKDQMRQ